MKTFTLSIITIEKKISILNIKRQEQLGNDQKGKKWQYLVKNWLFRNQAQYFKPIRGKHNSLQNGAAVYCSMIIRVAKVFYEEGNDPCFGKIFM